MKIDLRQGYCFKLNEAKSEYYMGASNIIQAKEMFLQYLSDRIDTAISEDLWRLSQLER